MRSRAVCNRPGGVYPAISAALKQDPKDRWALAQRATAYRRAGEIGKAEADLDSLQGLMNDAQASPGTTRD